MITGVKDLGSRNQKVRLMGSSYKLEMLERMNTIQQSRVDLVHRIQELEARLNKQIEENAKLQKRCLDAEQDYKTLKNKLNKILR